MDMAYRKIMPKQLNGSTKPRNRDMPVPSTALALGTLADTAYRKITLKQLNGSTKRWGRIMRQP